MPLSFINLKKIYAYALLFLCPFLLFSQNNILGSMQGLAYHDGLIFEIEGYSIIVEKNQTKMDEKGLKKIKKKYELENITSEYSDPRWPWENYMIEGKRFEKSVSEVTNYQLCYLIPETDDRMTVVLLESPNRRDTILEQAFMNAFFHKQLPRYISKDWNGGKIRFAGRTILLGSVCSWVSPYNVHCPAFGQISWSEFKTLEDAEINNNAHYLTNTKSGMYKIEKEETVDIIFEGIPTQAKRVICKINRSKILLGGRNLMAVYFVVQKVRGRYVSCVLSHYIEDKNNYFLAPLLEEVMSLDVKDKNSSTIPKSSIGNK